MDLKHKHMMSRFEAASIPFKTQNELYDWFVFLIQDILKMKILSGPWVKYVSKEGNKGHTGVTIIETSHVAMHIWDEPTPKIIQFDVYSCANFDPDQVVLELEKIFDVSKKEVLFMDRDKEFKILDWYTHEKESAFRNANRSYVPHAW